MSNDSSEPESSPPTVAAAQTAPWKSWLGLVMALAIFLGAQAVASIILLFYAGAQGWPEERVADWLTSSVTAQFAYMAIAQGLVVALVIWFVRRYKNGLRAIGLRRPKWSDLGWGVVAFPVYLLFLIITTAVLSALIPGLDVDQKQHLGFDDVGGQSQLLMTFVALVILPPIAEELIFRGVLYSSLKKALRIGWAILITSLLFAVGHLPEGGPSGPLYIAAIDTFVLSLALIYLREKTGGLWASITLHAVKNGVAFVSLFVLHLG